MVKQLRILALIIPLCIIMCSCFGPGLSDWDCPLINDYEIGHINGNNIICEKRNDEYSSGLLVGDYVTKFTYDDTFIYLQYLEVYDENYKEFEAEDFKYSIINAYTDEIAFYDSYDEFLQAIPDTENLSLDNWTPTIPSPKNAKFIH